MLDDADGCLLIHELPILPENAYHYGNQHLIIRLQHFIEVHLNLPRKFFVSRSLTDLLLHCLHCETLNKAVVLIAINRQKDNAFSKPKRGGSAEDIIHIIFVEEGRVEDYFLVGVAKEEVLIEAGHLLDLVHEVKIRDEESDGNGGVE